MLAIERIETIMQILMENGSAMVSDLSHRLEVSEETIRRDFEKLESQKRIRRVHGGAYLINDYTREVPSELRKSFFVEEKQRIAACALAFIDDWDCVMLDSSTTSLFICKQIVAARKNVSVLTNSLDIINELAGHEFVHATLIGGTFNNSTHSFEGHASVQTLEKHFAHKAFISCAAVHQKFGITDNKEGHAVIRETRIANSLQTFLAVDHTKLNKVAGVGIAPLSSVSCVITDQPLSKEWKTVLEKLAIKTVIAD